MPGTHSMRPSRTILAALLALLIGATIAWTQTSTYDTAVQTRDCISALPLKDTVANRTKKSQCVALANAVVAALTPPPPPPPPPVELCGDGIDNDGDGVIDEGCPTSPTLYVSPTGTDSN